MSHRLPSPWLLGALGVTVAIAAAQRKMIMLYGRKAVTQATEAIWIAQLPSHARPFGPVILQVAKEEGLDPNLIFALGDRESGWGRYLDADLKGDGGRGHGYMQIDIGSFASWLATHNWRDPYTNVKKGAQVLKGKLRFFEGRSSVRGYTDGTWVSIDKSAGRLGVSPGKYRDPRPLSGSALWTAAIAAYNTGEANVLMNLAAGKPAEFTTTGGEYATNVSKRASAQASRYDTATV